MIGSGRQFDFKPTDINGCVLWLRSDVGVSRDESGNVSSWVDQSPAGNHFTQPTANLRPAFERSKFNNYPALINNDATRYLLNVSSLTGSMGGTDIPFTMFFAAELLATGNQNLIGAGSTGGGGQFFLFNFTTTGNEINKKDDAAANVDVTGGTTSANKHIIECFSSGIASSYVLDGVTTINNVAQDIGACTFNQVVLFGRIIAGTVTAYRWRIAEAAWYTRNLSAPERSVVRTYMSRRYQIPVAL